jgi:hypothetical protein
MLVAIGRAAFLEGVAVTHHNRPDSVPIERENLPARTPGGILGKGGVEHRFLTLIPRCRWTPLTDQRGPSFLHVPLIVDPRHRELLSKAEVQSPSWGDHALSGRPQSEVAHDCRAHLRIGWVHSIARAVVSACSISRKGLLGRLVEQQLP